MGPGKNLGTRTLLPLYGALAFLAPFAVLFLLGWLTLPKHHLDAVGDVLQRSGEQVGKLPDDVVLAPFAWATSALVLAVALVVGLLVLVYVIWRYRRHQKHVVLIAGVGLAVSVFLARSMHWSQDQPVQTLLEMLLSIEVVIERPRSAMFTDTLAAVNVFLLIWAYCILCMRLPEDGGEKELARRRRYLKWLLYLSAIHLTTGVVQIFWTLLLPGNAELLSVTHNHLISITSGITLWFGASFTLLLLCVFGPAAVVLGEETKDVTPDLSPEQKTEWLQARGLSSSNWEQLLKTAAVLAPLLSALVGEPVGRLFSALGGGG